jgi:chaperonin cofactor prefoldin
MTQSALAAPRVATKESIVDETGVGKLERQNEYLKLRCAQLQDDVTNLSSELTRLRQELERLHGRRADTQGGSPA